MANLFAYGSLQVPDVFFTVTGKLVPCALGVLENYQLCRIRNRSFPGIRPQPGAHCPGTLYFDLDAETFRRLDEFEDDFYERANQTIQVNGDTAQAETYTIKANYLDMLLNEPWNLEEFKSLHLVDFLNHHR